MHLRRPPGETQIVGWKVNSFLAPLLADSGLGRLNTLSVLVGAATLARYSLLQVAGAYYRVCTSEQITRVGKNVISKTKLVLLRKLCVLVRALVGIGVQRTV